MLWIWFINSRFFSLCVSYKAYSHLSSFVIKKGSILFTRIRFQLTLIILIHKITFPISLRVTSRTASVCHSSSPIVSKYTLTVLNRITLVYRYLQLCFQIRRLFMLSQLYSAFLAEIMKTLQDIWYFQKAISKSVPLYLKFPVSVSSLE